jgi:hypothetical protein
MNVRTTLTAGLMLTALAGCRAEPGDADYEGQEQFKFDAGATRPQGFVNGPDPYQQGEDRFKIGVFYEGGASEERIINDDTTHFYVFRETEPDGPFTFTVEPDFDDKREGVQSDRIVHLGTGFLGGGVHWDFAEDLSAWTHLHVSLNSSSATFAEFQFGMTNGDGAGDARVNATDYGYRNDGAWHDLKVPLADLEALGLDLTAVKVPLIMGAGSGESGDFIRIDAVWLSAE